MKRATLFRQQGCSKQIFNLRTHNAPSINSLATAYDVNTSEAEE